jgi:general secretion pathway protein D
MTSRFARLCLAGLLLTPVVAELGAQTPGGPLPQNPRPTPPPTSAPAPAPIVPTAPMAAPAPAAPLAPRPMVPPPVAATKPANDPDELVSLKLPDADIDTVLSTLEIYSGKIILRPAQLPTAPGGYNLKIPKSIPKSEAILYIETILAMNQIAVIPMGEDALKIVPLMQARAEAPEMISGSTLTMPPSSKVASKFFQLDFLRVGEFAGMLGMISNPNISPQPVQFPNANALLVTDTISNLQRIEMLLQEVDKPLMQGMNPKFYALHHAKASDLVGKLHAMLGVGALQSQLGQATSYNADDRTNQIILITDPRQYPFFDQLISQLDIESDPNTRNDVIYLKHAKASDVVSALGGIVKGQTQQASQRTPSMRPTPQQVPMQGPNGGPAAQSSGPVIVSAGGAGNQSLDQGSTNQFSALMTMASDERSNSIIVSGTLDDLRMIRDLIEKLDIVLAQVRIEVVIAEITLDDNHQSGIDALGLKLDGDRLVGFTASGPSFGVSGPNTTTGGNSTIDFATISRIGGPGSLARSLDLVGIVTLGTTTRKDNTTILSVPTITTTHAKDGSIFVGETHPIVTGSVNSGSIGGTTSTTTQQQIGINLTVTPLIGNDGTVQLAVKQDVDEVGPNVTIDGNPVPIIFKRTTDSFITVRDGEIIVLGGLQRSVTTQIRRRLGPIPIIGDLLGSRQKEQKRTELIFFLRPHILTNTPTDNIDAFHQVQSLPQRDEIMKQVDPKYQPPKKSIIDRILPK